MKRPEFWRNQKAECLKKENEAAAKKRCFPPMIPIINPLLLTNCRVFRASFPAAAAL